MPTVRAYLQFWPIRPVDTGLLAFGPPIFAHFRVFPCIFPCYCDFSHGDFSAEAALARLPQTLSPADQRTIVEATRTPHRVRWPEWWSERP
jgi:hypothetical protein